jgi:hypothetical protein
MSTEELYAWSAYYTLKAEEEDKAYKDAQRKASRGTMR